MVSLLDARNKSEHDRDGFCPIESNHEISDDPPSSPTPLGVVTGAMRPMIGDRMSTPSSPNRSLAAADAEKLLDMLSLAERLKREMRHSWLSDGRQESVAEHTG